MEKQITTDIKWEDTPARGYRARVYVDGRCVWRGDLVMTVAEARDEAARGREANVEMT